MIVTVYIYYKPNKYLNYTFLGSVAVTVKTVSVSQQPPSGIISFSCSSATSLSLSNCTYRFGDCQEPFIHAHIDCNDPSASNRPSPTPSGTLGPYTIRPSTPGSVSIILSSKSHWYIPTASSKLPSLRPTSTSDDDDLVEIVGYVLGTAAGVVIIILVTICLFIIVIKRQNKRNQQQQELNELSY